MTVSMWYTILVCFLGMTAVLILSGIIANAGMKEKARQLDILYGLAPAEETPEGETPGDAQQEEQK